MKRLRPELIRGIGVLGIFLGVIITAGIFLPIPLSQSDYVSVDIQVAMYNHETFYQQNISSTATAGISFYLHPHFVVPTNEGVYLFFEGGIDSPEPEISPGDTVYFRGTIYNNSVTVHEYYDLDRTSSIIRSVPGIILFIVMFFMIFRIDFKRLAFVEKRGGAEST